MSSRHSPSSSACPPVLAPLSVPLFQGVLDSRIRILPIADSFNKHWDCAKLITKIMKAPFVEAHPRGENGLGLCTVGPVCPTALAEGTVGRYTIQRVLGDGKYQELKANAECLHIDTGSPIPTDEQLMFEAAVAATRAMSMVSAHSLQPSPQNVGEAAATRHQFLRYLLRQPTSPILRGRGGCRDTCSRHMTSSPAS
ncbi:hypothetical protein M9H77_07967 [Catharanthus roseus]|uniref:Uncharacterized protein n=1 Tax=Catharanthus roseus TaxID=4058 RepID=A0ACC0BWE4_CATRO|nr:hypothetical protein M9H77_07967 [Catharanthus roseus]